MVVADGELASRGPAAQPAVSQACPHRAAVGAVQVGDDARRQGRHPQRRLEVDLRRGQPRARARVARRVRRGRRRHRHRAGRRSAADGARSTACARQPRRVVFDSLGAAAAGLAARPRRADGPADGRGLARRPADRHRRAGDPRRRGDRGDRRERAGARRARRSTSSAPTASARSCSRAAHIWPARSSTPARSTRCGCSSRRWCSAGERPATRSRARASSAIADAGAGADARVRARGRRPARLARGSRSGERVFTGSSRTGHDRGASDAPSDGARLTIATPLAGELERGRLGRGQRRLPDRHRGRRTARSRPT